MKTMMSHLVVLVCAAVAAEALPAQAVAPVELASEAPAWTDEGKTLYEKFGGKEGVARIVNDFVGFVVADDRINFQFANLKPEGVTHLVKMLNEQLCAATGGGCKYTGRDMKSTHAHMAITNAQFNALAEDMQKAWDKNKVPFHTQNQLMAILAPMQKDIVTK